MYRIYSRNSVWFWPSPWNIKLSMTATKEDEDEKEHKLPSKTNRRYGSMSPTFQS